MKKNFKKLKIAILFGGKSVEHEISMMSAKNVASAMDKDKYEIVYVGIDKDGRWLLTDKNLEIKNDLKPISLVPRGGIRTANQGDATSVAEVDAVFPILHGPYGEDGTVQGLLKLAGIPFVGPSILGSAVGFDKDLAKRLLNEAKIPNTRFIAFKLGDKIIFSKVKKILGLPMIIKPANSGSSVGINKVENEKEFNHAVKHAFLFDWKIIIEKFIGNKREIECAILGNENPKASVCGEVITAKKHKFYSYKAKYFDPEGAICEIPARIPKVLENKIRNLAIKTFQVLECEGMTRVDFFLEKNGQVLVNEVNTIPGFTNISMYPRLWEKSGIKYDELVNKLIEFAIKRHEKEQKLKTSYSE
jgi:D-alanine-D-alanine ligase